MNRRTLVQTAVAGTLVASLTSIRRMHAQEATPVPGIEILNIRWQLDRINSGESVVTPDDPSLYWVQFQDDGKLAIRADCNQGGASFEIDGSSIKLGAIFSTMVACSPTSIADQFLKDLKYIVSYTVAGDLNHQLVLNMMADGGQLLFNPALSGVVWEWVEFQGGDDSVVKSSDPSRYTIEFLEDGTVQVVADCNSGSGPATIAGSSIDLVVATTRMACPSDSQSNDFLRYLDEAVSFVIRDGRLALALPADAGIAFFRPTIPKPETATPAA